MGEMNEGIDNGGEQGLPAELANLPPDELRYLQLVATLQKVANDVQSWLQRAEAALHNHNLRLNVIETLLCHPEFTEERKKFVLGVLKDNIRIRSIETSDDDGVDAGLEIVLNGGDESLKLEDLQRIATDYIQPELQKRAAEMQEARDKHFAKLAAEQEGKSASSGSVILDPNTGRPATENKTLLTPDGRQVIIRED